MLIQQLLVHIKQNLQPYKKLDELKANVKKHDIDQEDDESFMFETVDDQFQYTIQEIQVPFA